MCKQKIELTGLVKLEYRAINSPSFPMRAFSKFPVNSKEEEEVVDERLAEITWKDSCRVGKEKGSGDEAAYI